MKYSFTYKPVRKLPRTLPAFLRYVFDRNPLLWITFLIQDIIHFARTYVIYIILGLTIDSLTGLPQGSEIPENVWWYVAIGAAYFIFAEYMHIWSSYQTTYWKPFIRTAIRTDFFEHTLNHSVSFLNDNFSGALTRKITEVANSVDRLHDIVRFKIGYGVETAIATTVILFYISPLYGMGTLLYAAAIALPLFWRLKRISYFSRQYADERALVTGTIVDSLTNSNAVKSFAHASHEMARHQDVSAEENKSFVRLRNRVIGVDLSRRAALTLFSSGMLVFCLLGWQNGLISLGDVATIMGTSLALMSNAWIFSDGIMTFFDESGNITDALNIINTPHSITNHPAARDLTVDAGHLLFSDVTFSYNNEPVFQTLTLDIPSGQRIGLIGHSGAGKSTLINLLLRFYDLQNGAITIDGQNIADVTQESLRQNIAVIPQDTSLFHRSLVENIRYGKLDATDEEVIEAAQKAHAHEFITNLPKGYETLVGERGVKLSGGQRQRIAIARAILKDAPILVLDEATSALDSESEKLIQESLKDLMQGKTVIAIAHRLSTISHLDRLIVMDQGRIIEDGTHEELLKKEGLYKKLWAMQSGGFLGE